MDPVKFLDDNIPFDETKLAFLDNIVNVFYHTKNNNEVKFNLYSVKSQNRFSSSSNQIKIAGLIVI